MVDLDALKSELATSPWWIDGGMTNRDLDAAMAIIARHVTTGVTPEPDAEVRDVLAEAVGFRRRELAGGLVTDMDRLSARDCLAALRARGFAVVRTADVEDDIAWTIRDLTEDGMDPRGIAKAVLSRIQEAIR